jgi:8-oxo-dGTP pyrophosphatase MutT (NUDIX family)
MFLSGRTVSTCSLGAPTRSATRRGYLHTVGGKLELDEDPYAGAVREVREETGLTVKNMRLEAVLTELAPPPDFDHNWVIYHFSADFDSGRLRKPTRAIWCGSAALRL